MTPPQPQPLDLVRSVAGNCDRMHLLFGTGESPVDCNYQYPRFMALSLPSRNFHDEHIGIVRKYYDNWCGSVMLATGEASQFVRTFRREQLTQSIMCGTLERKES